MSDESSERRKTPYARRSLRAEAESKLASHPIENLTHDATVEKMLHELQVHQIELEMQNEELRQAHIALEESRDRYLDLFEFAPIGYFTLTSAGLIAEVNFIGAGLLGVERKKLLLRPFSKYIAPEFSDQFHLRLLSLLHDEEQQSYDMQIKREDDSKKYVHVDALRVEAEDGTITLRITVTDISENKRIEEALRISEERFRTVAEAVPQIIWITKPDGANIYFNQKWMDYTGLTLEQSLGHGWNIPFHPDDKQQAWDAWQNAVNNQGIYSIESRLRRADGVYHWWLIRGVPLLDKQGKIINWYGTCTDISAQKETEQNLRIAAIAFEAQEGILVTDKQNIIISVNKAFSRLTGYSAAEAIGKNASLINSRQHDSTFFKVMFETINRNQYWQGEIWNQRKNGEIFPSLMTVTAVVDTDGSISNFVGSFLDITVQKQAEKVLLDSRKQLEKQVEKTASELTAIKGESEEVNTALKVMIKMRNTENSDAKNLLNQELNQEVLPFLQRLKSGNQDVKQVRLISTLEANLQRLITSYGSPTTITSSYRSLTPKEIQVATMVREGFSTKAIASTLSLSPETISIHRKNIRKKLGLGSKGENLRSYLITF